eukprot:TRINITY_DN912_c0_g1_i2.p1 TRINITY_DN912_c0_g1~~TRINITY_DN912_c0_g1_i2.p1  ORF type:complete len:111 (-),score=10.35 TRINITY_DN912_c0_g1_i2:11-343(-)
MRSFQRGRILTVNGERGQLPPQLQGHLPENIRIRSRLDTTDIPEHRQMAACLASWRAWLRAIAEGLDGSLSEDNRDRKVSAEIWSRRCLTQIGRAVQQECRDRSRMPSSA